MRKYNNNLLRLCGYELVRAVVRTAPARADSRTFLLDATVPLEVAQESDFDLTATPLGAYFAANRAGDVHKWFHYFSVYHQAFERFRHRAGLKVLEIGVSKGGSLKLWRHYFDPSAVIVGVDINPSCRQFENASQNIFVRIGEQQNADFLRAVINEFGPFDIVIDDGSHVSAHQIATFDVLYREGLKDAGVYLVEDTHFNYWEVAREGLAASETFMHYAKQLVDRLHEPYQRFLGPQYFDVGGRLRAPSCPVTYFCANTESIVFADSMVVFSKKRRFMPATQTR